MEVAFQPTRRKRGNNEGSIRKRQDGRWEAQYSAKRQSDGRLSAAHSMASPVRRCRRSCRKRLSPFIKTSISSRHVSP